MPAGRPRPETMPSHEETSDDEDDGSGGGSLRGPIIGSVALAALLVCALLFFDEAKTGAVVLIEWIDSLGGAGMAAFFGLYVLAVLLILPGVVLTLGGGFLFGFWIGAGLVVASLAVGSGLAFLIARHLFGEGMARRLESRPSLKAINRGLERDGWKLVALSRCMPGFPYKLSNYFFGLTAISFRDFFLANLVGVIPLSLTNVYIGAAAANLAALAKQEPQPWQWALYAAGFVAALATLALLTRMARRAMQEAKAAA